MNYYWYLLIAWVLVPGPAYVLLRKKFGHCDHDWKIARSVPPVDNQYTYYCTKCRSTKTETYAEV